MSNDGTIDITDLVEKVRAAWVQWAIDFLLGLALSTPGFSWVNLPFFKAFITTGLKIVLNPLSKSLVMLAFFENTAIRKAGQAKDFTDAVNALNQLPPTTGDEEYEKAERARIAAFDRFVRISN